ncbi:MAG TPA: DUF6776 family protein [Gammaproteobacteria bacterium]|nr:DUF6776 family protein [Gammaproteobacteria bacterium]
MAPRHRVVVKREHHAHRPIVIGLVVVAVVAGLVALAATFYFGERWGGYRQFASHAEKAKISRALAARSSQAAALTDRVAFLERSLSLANASASALKANVVKQQAKQVDLEQKVAFYQRFMQPAAGDGAKVRIAGLQLLPTGRAHDYRFQIVLVRADGKTSPTLEGRCKLEVSGTRKGKPESLSLAALSPRGAEPLDFTLRYFTNLSGALRLPAGFSPEAVKVEVEMKGEPEIAGTYSWPMFRG